MKGRKRKSEEIPELLTCQYLGQIHHDILIESPGFGSLMGRIAALLYCFASQLNFQFLANQKPTQIFPVIGACENLRSLRPSLSSLVELHAVLGQKIHSLHMQNEVIHLSECIKVPQKKCHLPSLCSNHCGAVTYLWNCRKISTTTIWRWHDNECSHNLMSVAHKMLDDQIHHEQQWWAAMTAHLLHQLLMMDVV